MPPFKEFANLYKPTMNRLLAFKKQKVPSAAADSDTSDKRLWRRKRPTPEQPKIEPKPVVNTVLPPSEQFRTSLIMPNLSARFSMLREQDDPTSVIGKASDDSVLQPKRKSRLIDFGAAGGALGDIAEVSSIIESIGTNVSAPRKTSYTYGEKTPTKKKHSSVEESIMNRARGDLGLAQGNISPRRSPRNSPRKNTPRKKSLDLLNGEPPRMSPFKQYRQVEKQHEVRHDLEEFKRQYKMNDDSWTRVVLASPKLSFEEKRKQRHSAESATASLSSAPTASSPLSMSMLTMTETPATTARSSPAIPYMQATDTATHSQPEPELQRKQSQRVYGESLGKHTFEQRSAALTRLTSVRRNPSVLQRAPGTNNLLADVGNNEENKNARPQLAKLTTFDSFRRPRENDPTTEEPTSPMLQSPPLSPFDEMAEEVNPLYNMMNINDRGKATAMGLFQKPDKFDERQYLQRQMSLMQQQRTKRKSALPLSPRKATFPGKNGSPAKSPRRFKTTRPRGATDASDRSWTAGSDDAFDVVSEEKENDNLKQIDSANETIQVWQSIPETVEEVAETEGTLPNAKRTQGQQQLPKPAPLPPLITHQNEESPSSSTHPALRSMNNNIRARRNGWSPDRLLAAKSASPRDEVEQHDWQSTNDENADPIDNPKSPKLFELKGMVRSHLRQQSDASTIFPTKGHVPSMYMSAWDSSSDLEKLIGSGKIGNNHSSSHLSVRPSPLSSKSPKNVTLRALISQEEVKTKSPRLDGDSRQHTRGGSSETQHERRAFADELAQRQKTIQENLKIKVENESRANSPAATNRSPLDLPLKPFAMLRAKASRESLIPLKTQDSNSKGNRWVDMSAGETNAVKPGDKDAGREPLSPGIGRTLHSKLKPADETAPVVKKASAIKKEVVPEVKIITHHDKPRPSKDSSRSATSAASTTKEELTASTTNSSTRTAASSEKGRTSADSQIEETSLPPALAATAPTPPPKPTTLSPVPKPNPPLALHPTTLPPIPTKNPSPSSAARPSPPAKPSPPSLPQAPAPTPTALPHSSLLRRRAHAYAHQLQPRKADNSSSQPHIRKADISNPIALLASTFPGDVVALPEGASLKNGMRGSGDFEDVVLAARGGYTYTNTAGSGVGRPSAGGRSASADVVVAAEKDKRSGYAKGFERSFLARVGRSVSANKERRQVS